MVQDGTNSVDNNLGHVSADPANVRLLVCITHTEDGWEVGGFFFKYPIGRAVSGCARSLVYIIIGHLSLSVKT